VSIVSIDRMYVDVRGEGDAVVFVHGLGGSMNAWTPLLPALARHRCVRPELPGAGRSTRAYALGEATPHKGRISTATHVDALRRVCEVLGITRAHFVGHSFGTIIAQHLAAEAPQLVRSLALFGAMAEPPQNMRDNMVGRAPVAREQGMFGIAEGISDFALSASSKQNQPVTVAYVRDSISAQDPEGFARNCEALADARSAALDLIRCPVLIVNGDEDQVTTLSGARALAARLANARVEVFGRCGHWPMFERTAESQRVLRDFLDRVR
jgi:pimeloyl-ACP methyl ester carboxylesterase